MVGSEHTTQRTFFFVYEQKQDTIDSQQKILVDKNNLPQHANAIVWTSVNCRVHVGEYKCFFFPRYPLSLLI